MSAHRSTGRRVARIVLAVVSALVLVATVVGAGVSVVMGQLQGNITAIDVTEQIGLVESKPIAAVNEETGTFEPLIERPFRREVADRIVGLLEGRKRKRTSARR